MKAALVPVVLLSFSTLASADGLVDFRNAGITFRTPGDRLIRVAQPGSAPLTGTNYVAQLYFGLSPQTLASVSEPPAHFRSALSTLAGSWNPGLIPMRLLSGYNPGDAVWLQVRVWDGAKFATYEEAFAAGEAWGAWPFTYVIPLAGSPPNAYYMENFHPFETPESVYRFFPPVVVSNEVVLSWRAPPGWVLYQAVGPSPSAWQGVPNSPTNGILKLPMTNDLVLFQFGPRPTPP